MGFDIGGAINSVTNAVKNTVSSVSNSVNHAVDTTVKSTANAWDRNRDNFENSDIGRVTKVVFTPVASIYNAGREVYNGKLDQAFGQMGASVNNMDLNTRLINSSSSLRELYNSDGFNNVTGGLSRDAVRKSDAFDHWRSEGEISPEDVSATTRYGVRAAIYGAGAYGLSESGYGAKGLSWAQENPAQAAMSAKLAAEGRYGDIAAAVADEYIPGIGHLISGPSKGDATPWQGSPPMVENYDVGPMDTKTIIALAAALFIFTTVIFKKLRG